MTPKATRLRNYNPRNVDREGERGREKGELPPNPMRLEGVCGVRWNSVALNLNPVNDTRDDCLELFLLAVEPVPKSTANR